MVQKKKSDVLKTKYGEPIWGIYADSKVAAKMLAFGTGCYDAPEVHGYGGYGHYHDSHHFVHIWFGSPLTRIFEDKVRASL